MKRLVAPLLLALLALAPELGAAGPQPVAPNLYKLRGADLVITYSTTGIDGRPHFSYQDAHQTLNFAGPQIRTVALDLGTVVSVTLRQTVDTGSTTFSMLVPATRVSGGQPAQIRTEGITTIHRFSIVPAMNMGQTETYSVTSLAGTAQSVIF